jgi:hypothetical protein
VAGSSPGGGVAGGVMTGFGGGGLATAVTSTVEGADTSWVAPAPAPLTVAVLSISPAATSACVAT